MGSIVHSFSLSFCVKCLSYFISPLISSPCFTHSPCLCPRWQVGNNFTSPLPQRSYYPCYIYRLLFLMKVLCHVHGNFKRAEPMKNLRIIINQADTRIFIASHVGSLFVCDDFRIGSQESKTFIHNSRKYPFVPTSNQRFEKKYLHSYRPLKVPTLPPAPIFPPRKSDLKPRHCSRHRRQ